jgi:hypothetical protein
VSLSLAAMALVMPVGAAADGSMDFAQSLMAEQDYFRAITELKEVKFFSTDERLRELCDITIGEAYLWSNKYDMSISTFGRVLSAGALDTERSREVDILLGLDYIGLRAFQVAEPYFQKALDSGNGFFPKGFSPRRSRRRSRNPKVPSASIFETRCAAGQRSRREARCWPASCRRSSPAQARCTRVTTSMPPRRFSPSAHSHLPPTASISTIPRGETPTYSPVSA